MVVGGLRNLSVLFWMIIIQSPPVFAQIVTDGTVGTLGNLGVSQILAIGNEPVAPDVVIGEDLGTLVGKNLFHSFSEFNIKAGGSATFTADTTPHAAIGNVVSRVTGNNPSNIDGTLRSTIDGANLYLLNPNGVFFGPNAQVDVSGSFVVSTADYLKLQDGGEFHGSLDEVDTLTTAPPSAFGFSSASIGSITFVGNEIVVADKQSFVAVGGNITLDEANVITLGGHVHLTSVNSAGEVMLNVADSEMISDVGMFEKLGSIAMNGSIVDVSGAPAGQVVFKGSDLSMINSKINSTSTGATGIEGAGVNVGGFEEILLVNTSIVSSITNAEDGGSILIADVGSLFLEHSSRILSNAESGSTGDGGWIILDGIDEIRLTGESVLQSATYSQGDSGMIRISGVGNLLLDDQSCIVVNAESGSTGNAGQINLSGVDAIRLMNASDIRSATFGAGDAGMIMIDKVDVFSLETGSRIVSNAEIGSGGNGGWMILDGISEIRMTGESTLQSATYSQGDGGMIKIFDVVNLLLDDQSCIVVNAESGSTGNAGQINLSGVDAIRLTRASDIRSTTFGTGDAGTITIGEVGPLSLETGSRIVSNAEVGSIGNAGTIILNDIAEIELTGLSSIQSTGYAQVDAGSIFIHSTGNLILKEGSFVTTEAIDANGGSIKITTGSTVILEDSRLVTGAYSLDDVVSMDKGNGGDISIYTVDRFEMRNSQLLTEAFNTGGNIYVDPELILIDRSSLITRVTGVDTVGEGVIIHEGAFTGGNITLIADVFIKSSDSFFNAYGQTDGVVEIQSMNVVEDGNLLVLPGSLLDADSYLPERCAVKLDGDYSSLIVVGRGGVPLTPDGYMPSYQLSGRDWNEEKN